MHLAVACAAARCRGQHHTRRLLDPQLAATARHGPFRRHEPPPTARVVDAYQPATNAFPGKAALHARPVLFMLVEIKRGGQADFIVRGRGGGSQAGSPSRGGRQGGYLSLFCALRAFLSALSGLLGAAQRARVVFFGTRVRLVCCQSLESARR